MKIKKELEIITSEFARIRQLLQDGRRVTHEEYEMLKSQIYSLTLSLESNYRRSEEHP